MPTRFNSAAIVGLDAMPVEVEGNVDGDITAFSIVGLGDTSIHEAKDRVRSAIKNSDLSFPLTKITVNLAPADLRKTGPLYDLPIALAIISAYKEQLIGDFRKKLFIGELALNGELRHISGALPIAMMAKNRGFEEIYVPKHDADEAALVKGIKVYGVRSLKQLVNHLNNIDEIEITNSNKGKNLITDNTVHYVDLADIKGQSQVKRALEISAAGAHNILMSGPPGSGKTMISKAMISILPQMQLEESLDVTKIHSIAELLPRGNPLMTIRPFRSPHHSASTAALVGGGTYPRPGEISLAHRGVLFLDEFPEFSRTVLESLRQPLEDGIITISRAQKTLTFPAKFILVASMNPCPCGYATDPDRECVCTDLQKNNYKKKLSGPLLDRIDINIEVPRVNVEKLQTQKNGEASARVLERIEIAREIQKSRFKKTAIITNSEMSSKQVREICKLETSGKQIMRSAAERMNLSARAYFRILKIARTIADIEGEENILNNHISEALQYRENA